MAEAVRFELTAPCGTTVFKTAALNQTQPHFHKLLVPQTGLEPATELSLEQPRLPSILRHWGMEHRVRFELTVLRICNPLHWATLPPVHNGTSGRNRTFSRTLIWR